VDYLIEQIEASTGAKFLRVPFQGGGAGINALVGGNVDVAQGFYSEFRGHLEGGKVAPLAVAAAGRMDFLKEMPTFNEALGGTEYLWQVIRFAVVPKGTPADRKAYLGAQVQTAMKDPELVRSMASRASISIPSSPARRTSPTISPPMWRRSVSST